MLYERYGSLEFTGGWIEEAGEVNFGAYDILKTRIGRCNNDKYGLNSKFLITCNPKKNWLYTEFYKPWRGNEFDENKAFIQSLVDDNPYNESGYKQNLISIKEKATKQRLLYGNWEYDDDPSQLIDYDHILNMFTNEFVKGGEKFITADIARKGRDKTVIGLWDGCRCEEIKRFDQNKITEAAEYIKQIRIKNGIPLRNIIVDEDGIGGGVVDILECWGFVNNSRAIGNENYANLKSQCYYKFAERVNNDGYYIITDNEELKNLIIEDCEQIKQDNLDKDGKVSIIKKETVKEMIGRSPDYSDMLMMREWFDLGLRRRNR